MWTFSSAEGHKYPDKKSRCMDRLIKGAMYTELHPNSIEHENGFFQSRSWKSLVHTMKEEKEDSFQGQVWTWLSSTQWPLNLFVACVGATYSIVVTLLGLQLLELSCFSKSVNSSDLLEAPSSSSYSSILNSVTDPIYHLSCITCPFLNVTLSCLKTEPMCSSETLWAY
jgi:hypothetical protein